MQNPMQSIMFVIDFMQEVLTGRICCVFLFHVFKNMIYQRFLPGTDVGNLIHFIIGKGEKNDTTFRKKGY
ncbi:hypothetical protein BRYFOR_09154 [Marvinbryantia formatexigens DSM 14469]|uniref:Uncharacterized protein n=1 Tax=Marvinbryantia formatexigens DSM 14469 TaxID=478749 RepID=C6LKG7_9FIRM|nr:hypothetical protein BRYFOR_09154 [Marvinbryantia formatexigens DSM 14469]